MFSSFFHQKVGLPAVTDSRDKNFTAFHFKHDAIIADSKLPVVFQRLAQGFSVLLGGRKEAGFYSPFHAFPDVIIELWNIALFHIRMIEKGK